MLAKKAALAAATSNDPRWAKVQTRDASADGSFFYSVATTGVYCRPSCGARAARPENVAFHATVAGAERRGFRACLRCKPDQPHYHERKAAWVARLCRILEESDPTPTLDQLAREVELSAFYMQRVFKDVTGVTPRAYATAHRASRMQREVTRQTTVTEAVYAAGYSSSARFYETASRRLGMTATSYRTGGPGETIRFAVGECSLGSILVASTAVGVCAILLGDDPTELTHDLERRFPHAQLVGADRDFERTVALVVGLVERPGRAAALPLDVRGTAFQERVWQALAAIPAGETRTYSDIAEALGAPRAVRAVAGACAANRLAVAIPCHRVVRVDGSLSGYRWGIERKRALLDREARS